MNKERRKAITAARAIIEAAFDKLEEARATLEEICSEEQDYFDSMPESFQNSEKGERAQAAIDALEEAKSAIEDFDFESIYSALETAGE